MTLAKALMGDGGVWAKTEVGSSHQQTIGAETGER